jgi:peptide/nickel transport system substrate-binding protein
MSIRFHGKLVLYLLLTMVFLLTACSTPVVTEIPQSTATAANVPTVTPTPLPKRTLVVCLGQEPTTLYPYGSASRNMWSVLEAVYDGPFDVRQYTVQSVILEKVPSLLDGDAAIQSVAVKAGDEVVNVTGALEYLTSGSRVLPSGCYSPDCAVSWDGSSPLQMDQMSVTFKLKAGIVWSDGEPLTADDSVYSFQISSDPATPVSHYTNDRTASYEALDDLTVRWVGKPGYLPHRYQTYFWLPLPRHAWQHLSAADLLTAPESSQKPLGWGPYMIEEWVIRDHITLRKNPSYFRAGEGLPKFDTLVFRFLGEPADNNIAALLAGECDIVDQTAMLDQQLEPILEMNRDKKLKAYIGQGPEWEQITFGIRPASYDDGYSAWAGDRPDFFSDLRVRQAFVYCMNRQRVIERVTFKASSIPVGLTPPSHPYFLADFAPLPYDPEAGMRLLDEAGWRDTDGDPATPRQAVGIPGVPDGTPLEVNYATTLADARIQTAEFLVESLKSCGIQVHLKRMETGELYAPGTSGGILFGRKFDLAQFGWESGEQIPCLQYTSSQIPTTENYWTGMNIGGYSNPAFDAACQAALSARPEAADYKEKQMAVQRLFAEELPAVPLYYRLKLAISRKDLCGLEMDVTARSLLWNLENIDYGEKCPVQ